MALLLAEPIDRPATLFGDAPDGEGARGGPTLDDALVDAWEGLAARRVVTCPVCRGALRPVDTGGHCADCGATLS